MGRPIIREWLASIWASQVAVEVRRLLLKTFHWKFAQFLLALFIPVGLAMIYADEFFWGYVSLLFGAVWATGFWVTSDELAQRKPRKPRKSTEFQIAKYEGLYKRYLVWKVGGVVAIVLILLIILAIVNHQRTKRDLLVLQGVLVPANDTPKNNCPGAGKDAFFMYTGSSIVYANAPPLAMFEVNGKKEFIINRDKYGNMLINLDVYSNDGRVVATIENNAFTVNQNNYLSMQRPDRSTLIVKDQYNEQVLYFRYLNKSAVQVEGTFRYPGIPPIVFSNDGEFIGGYQWHHMCYDFSGAGGVVFGGLGSTPPK